MLIIGSGIGGLSTAVRLLSKGYDVKVYEKEKTIGGKTNQLIHYPFTFDLTASIVLNREIYEEVFDDANLDYQNFMEFIKVEPIYRSFYPDGTDYDFSGDLGSLIKNLESISITDAIGYMKLLSEVYERYTIANKHFLRQSFERPLDFYNLPSLVSAIKTKSFSTSHQLISKYIKNEKLLNFLSYQSLYVGISPYEGPSIYTLVPVISQLYGLWHLKGGIYAYVKALEKAIYHMGGVIETNYAVDEIIVSGDKAIGIKSKDRETVFADIIICNADFPYAMDSLLKSEIHKGQYTKSTLSELKYTCSTFILYLGLNKKYPQLSVHNLFLNVNFKKNIESAFRGYLPINPSLYIYCPTRVDESMVAGDGECINIVVRVPNLFFRNIIWNEDTVKLMRNRTLSALKSIPGLGDIEENIIYENHLTPQNLRDCFNSYGGTAFGLSPTLTQTNYFRPHLKSDHVNNLYFVGSSVHPGPGVSIVLLSSKLVVQEILKSNCSCRLTSK